jgi:hypothetical protein
MLAMTRMDGGQWTPQSRARYNLRDTVARSTTQVREKFHYKMISEFKTFLKSLITFIVLGKVFINHSEVLIFSMRDWSVTLYMLFLVLLMFVIECRCIPEHGLQST